MGLLCMAGQAGSQGDGKAGRNMASRQGPIPTVPKQDEQSRSSGSPLTAGHVCSDKAGLRSSQKSDWPGKVRIRRAQGQAQHTCSIAHERTKSKDLILNTVPKLRAPPDETSDNQLFSQQLDPRLHGCGISKLILNTAS